MAQISPTDSATYPYSRVGNYLWMQGLEAFPKKICDYLLDLPLPGYEPKATNDYPRVRLMKYIYYDSARPLDEPALSTEQKLSILYDPNNASEAPTDKGYRIYPLSYTRQAQERAQTVLRCYIGRITPLTAFSAQVGIIFDVLSSMVYENNTRDWAMSRCLAIEQALWECLNGVNIDGVGAVSSDSRRYTESGSYNISDDNANVGRRISFAVEWQDSNSPPHQYLCDVLGAGNYTF